MAAVVRPSAWHTSGMCLGHCSRCWNRKTSDDSKWSRKLRLVVIPVNTMNGIQALSSASSSDKKNEEFEVANNAFQSTLRRPGHFTDAKVVDLVGRLWNELFSKIPNRINRTPFQKSHSINNSDVFFFLNKVSVVLRYKHTASACRGSRYLLCLQPEVKPDSLQLLSVWDLSLCQALFYGSCLCYKIIKQKCIFYIHTSDQLTLLLTKDKCSYLHPRWHFIQPEGREGLVQVHFESCR